MFLVGKFAPKRECPGGERPCPDRPCPDRPRPDRDRPCPDAGLGSDTGLRQRPLLVVHFGSE